MFQEQLLQEIRQLLNLRQLQLQLLTVRSQLGKLELMMRDPDPLLKPLAVYFEELVWTEEANKRINWKAFRFLFVGAYDFINL